MPEIDGFLQLEGGVDDFHGGGILIADGVAVGVGAGHRCDMGQAGGDDGSHGRGERAAGRQRADRNRTDAEGGVADHEGVDVGIAVVFDDEAKRDGGSIRGLEEPGARAGGAAVLTAIDRQLDVDARNNFDHFGCVVVRDGGSVGVGSRHRGRVAQIAADHRLDIGGADGSRRERSERDRRDSEGDVLNLRIRDRAAPRVLDDENIGDRRAIGALDAFNARGRGAAIVSEIDRLVDFDGGGRVAFDGLSGVQRSARMGRRRRPRE